MAQVTLSLLRRQRLPSLLNSIVRRNELSLQPLDVGLQVLGCLLTQLREGIFAQL